jgi:hypothetical protein
VLVIMEEKNYKQFSLHEKKLILKWQNIWHHKKILIKPIYIVPIYERLKIKNTVSYW